jgi:hypothetical protein
MSDNTTYNYFICTIINVRYKQSIYIKEKNVSIQTTNGPITIDKIILANEIRNIKLILTELKNDSFCDMKDSNILDNKCQDIKLHVISAMENLKQFVLDNGIDKEKIYIINYKILNGIDDIYYNDDSNSNIDMDNAKKSLSYLFTELFIYMDYTSMILTKRKSYNIKGSINMRHLDILMSILYNDASSIVKSGIKTTRDTFDNTHNILNKEKNADRYKLQNRSNFREYESPMYEPQIIEPIVEQPDLTVEQLESTVGQPESAVENINTTTHVISDQGITDTDISSTRNARVEVKNKSRVKIAREQQSQLRADIERRTRMRKLKIKSKYRPYYNGSEILENKRSSGFQNIINKPNIDHKACNTLMSSYDIIPY